MNDVFKIDKIEPPDADGNQYSFLVDGISKTKAKNLTCLEGNAQRAFAGQPEVQVKVLKTFNDYRG